MNNKRERSLESKGGFLFVIIIFSPGLGGWGFLLVVHLLCTELLVFAPSYFGLYFVVPVNLWSNYLLFFSCMRDRFIEININMLSVFPLSGLRFITAYLHKALLVIVLDAG